MEAIGGASGEPLRQLIGHLRRRADDTPGVWFGSPATLASRLWQGTMSVSGAQRVAEQGVGIMLARAAMGARQPTDVAQLPLIQAYNEAWGQRPELRRVALSRGIYPAADRRAALDGLRSDVLRFAENIAQQNNRALPTSLEEVCQQLHIAYGHPMKWLQHWPPTKSCPTPPT